MVYQWKNGKLVQTETDEEAALLQSLLERRERLEGATQGDTRNLFQKTIGGIGNIAKTGFMGALDIISRPSYAVQEGIASALDPNKRSGIGGSALDVAVGAGRGLWGTKKTSAIETLADAGKTGLPYTALGLASDIFLDPLTYAGAAPLRAVGSAQKTAAGSKALGEVTEQSLKVGDKILKFDKKSRAKAAIDLQAERIAQGLKPLGKKELKQEAVRRLTIDTETKALKRLNDDITKTYGVAQRSRTPYQHARKRVDEIEKSRVKFGMEPYTPAQRARKINELAKEEAFSIAKAAQVAAESAVDVKRAGLKLRFGKYSTEVRADNPLISKVVDQPTVRTTASKIVNSGIVQDLNKKFRTEGTFGNVLNEARKGHHAYGVASYDEIIGRKIDSAGGLSIEDLKTGLTEKEAKDFFRAYELGDLEQVEEVFKSGLRRDDVAALVRYHMDNIFDAEFEDGLIPFKKDKKGNPILDDEGNLIPAVEKVDNYLYHRPIKNQTEFNKLKRRQYAKAVGSDIHEPAVERTFKTAEDAAKAGVQIDTDLRTALLNRVAKHSQAMARASFVKDAAANFGVRLDSKQTLALMKKDGHDLVNLKSVLKDADKGAFLDYLPNNVYVDRHIADSMKGIQTVANNPGPLLNLMDNFLKRWKAGVTIYTPGHHIRNMQSDIMLGYLDGVNSIKPYVQAMDAVFNKNTAGHLAVGKGKLRKDQVIKLFHESGASPNFIQTELGTGIGGISPLGGRGAAAVRDISQKREEVVRMAHFFHALKDEAKHLRHGGEVTQEVLDAAARAGQRVKKWHVDYSDLTDFEKAVMKRVFPFYTWMRKSTPLMVEAMVLRPGKVANIDKSFQALFTQLGVDPGEALPTDQIPSWIRESIYGQVGSADGNPLFFQPDIPMREPFNWTQGGLPGALQHGLSSLNPVPKAVIELGMGRSTFTGSPIDQGVGRYAANTIPQTRLIEALIGGGSDRNVKLANWGLGASLRQVTPEGHRGEIRRQIDMLEGKLAEMNREYPYADGTRSAPKNRFVWKDGKLVKG